MNHEKTKRDNELLSCSLILSERSAHVQLFQTNNDKVYLRLLSPPPPLFAIAAAVFFLSLTCLSSAESTKNKYRSKIQAIVPNKWRKESFRLSAGGVSQQWQHSSRPWKFNDASSTMKENVSSFRRIELDEENEREKSDRQKWFTLTSYDWTTWFWSFYLTQLDGVLGRKYQRAGGVNSISFLLLSSVKGKSWMDREQHFQS